MNCRIKQIAQSGWFAAAVALLMVAPWSEDGTAMYLTASAMIGAGFGAIAAANHPWFAGKPRE